MIRVWSAAQRAKPALFANSDHSDRYNKGGIFVATYPATYQDWLALGYTGFPADYEIWKRNTDIFAAIVEERINTLTLNRRSGLITVPALATSMVVKFSSAMASANYRVFFSVEGQPSAGRFSYDPDTRTTEQFTMLIGLLNLQTKVAYNAVIDR